ncbi:MAG: dienelactone hydrolase family protein [Hyphomonadaceae bacterium]
MLSPVDHLVTYELKGETFEGYFAHAGEQTRPIVLVAHAWGGLSEFEQVAAQRLARLGYAAFAIDVYGKGKRGSSPDENTALMGPLIADRAKLQDRLAGAIEAAKAQEGVDPTRIAAIGFCFGGLCVLDMARTGADIQGVVSFHGLLGGAPNIPSPRVSAKVLALHGWADPLAKPEDVVAFGEEMTNAGADWQLHGYGNTVHAFTNPAADDRASGNCYDPMVTRRAWAACDDFLLEVLGQ